MALDALEAVDRNVDAARIVDERVVALGDGEVGQPHRAEQCGPSLTAGPAWRRWRCRERGGEPNPNGRPVSRASFAMEDPLGATGPAIPSAILHSYGLYSYGIYGYGLYSYGLYSYGARSPWQSPSASTEMSAK